MITGAAGFIGSHVARRFASVYPDYTIVCLDALTYAGNLENIADLLQKPRVSFVKADIRDAAGMEAVMREYEIDSVIHLAAESHVDRSIDDPLEFARTNVMGTLTLLDTARRIWEATPEGYEGKRFYQISTDEVYGALDMEPGRTTAPFGDSLFTESTPYSPRSPYSASKASADHFVKAYCETYGLPAVISNCSNNYGPNQFPEKLIPLFINNMLHSLPLPVYGGGENVRDWLYVEDHAEAIDLVFHRGATGSTYNIGGFNEWRNIDLVRELARIFDRITSRPEGTSGKLITFVGDRKGHDLRYAIDPTKITLELGWKPRHTFADAMEKTVRWYLDNGEWLDNVTSGEYRDYYSRHYNL